MSTLESAARSTAYGPNPEQAHPETGLPIFADGIGRPQMYEEFDYLSLYSRSIRPSTVRRAVGLSAPDHATDLLEVLALTDEHFGLLEKLGVVAVPHRWGLVPRSNVDPEWHAWYNQFENPQSGRKVDLLPKGFLLGAEVSIIDIDRTPLKSPIVQAQTREALDTYRERLQEKREPYLADLDLFQLSYGTVAMATASVDGSCNRPVDYYNLYLYDIEPRWTH